jgi:hypothetical protein
VVFSELYKDGSGIALLKEAGVEIAQVSLDEL